MMETLTAPFQRLSEKMDSLQRDLNEIRNVFVSVKNIIVAIFSFLGQETSVLLFCALLFVFLLNLIPFLFLGKKLRYYAGLAFGVWLSFKFGYAFLSTAKFILIMLLPLLVELTLAWILKKTGGAVKAGLKKLWKGMISLVRKMFGRKKKDDPA